MSEATNQLIWFSLICVVIGGVAIIGSLLLSRFNRVSSAVGRVGMTLLLGGLFGYLVASLLSIFGL